MAQLIAAALKAFGALVSSQVLGVTTPSCAAQRGSVGVELHGGERGR